MMNVPVATIFVLVVLPSHLVISGYQQFRTQTVEVNFNGKDQVFVDDLGTVRVFILKVNAY